MLTDNVARAIIAVDQYADSVGEAGTQTDKTTKQIDEATKGVITFQGSVQDIIDALDWLDQKQGIAGDSASELADRFQIVGGVVYDIVAQADEYADAVERNTKAIACNI